MQLKLTTKGLITSTGRTLPRKLKKKIVHQLTHNVGTKIKNK